MDDVSNLVTRLGDSVGEAIYDESVTGFELPEPRTSWVELQDEVVAVAGRCDESDRRRLARALLHAILEQPSYGPSNRLSAEAFDVIVSSLGDELAASLGWDHGTTYGGKRYLHRHIWSMTGELGVHWFGHLARVNDPAVNSLYQGEKPPWSDQDWSLRVGVLADLPTTPRPSILRVLFIRPVPKVAMPELMRVALRHGEDHRDPLVRFSATRVRSLRTSTPDADVNLFCWDEVSVRPDLARWFLELAGAAGDRAELVGAAVRAGRIDAPIAALMSEPLDRPAWADGEVPWTVESTASVGRVELPSRRLTGGDPWNTGGPEGLPWTIDVDSDAIDAVVVVAEHPLYGRECAALVALVGPGEVENWQLVEGGFDGLGYSVEVGVAGFGSVEFYDSAEVFDLVGDDMIGNSPIWRVASTTADGGVAMCTVGPQHQLCRTWCGRTAEGRVVQLVTDLGLLELDPPANPVLPW